MFAWAKIRNTPTLWPAKVLHYGLIAARVFVKSDNSEFDVKLSNLLPFTHEGDIKVRGIEKLKKKGMIDTLNSFVEDVKWAVDEHDPCKTNLVTKILSDAKDFDENFNQKSALSETQPSVNSTDSQIGDGPRNFVFKDDRDEEDKLVAENDGEVSRVDKLVAENDGEVSRVDKLVAENDGEVSRVDKLAAENGDNEGFGENKLAAEKSDDDDEVLGEDKLIAENDDEVSRVDKLAAENSDDDEVLGEDELVSEKVDDYKVFVEEKVAFEKGDDDHEIFREEKGDNDDVLEEEKVAAETDEKGEMFGEEKGDNDDVLEEEKIAAETDEKGDNDDVLEEEKIASETDEKGDNDDDDVLKEEKVAAETDEKGEMFGEEKGDNDDDIFKEEKDDNDEVLVKDKADDEISEHETYADGHSEPDSEGIEQEEFDDPNDPDYIPYVDETNEDNYNFKMILMEIGEGSKNRDKDGDDDEGFKNKLTPKNRDLDIKFTKRDKCTGVVDDDAIELEEFDDAIKPDYIPLSYEKIKDILHIDDIVSASEDEDETDGSNLLSGILSHWKKVENMDSEIVEIENNNIEKEIVTKNEIMHDKNYPDIYIKKILKCDHKLTGQNKTGNRVYNSLHSCLFCKKYFLHVKPHLIAKHNHIPDVSEAINDKSGDKFDRLRVLGDNENNKKVLEDKKGLLLLRRRPVKDFTIDDFGPCPNCHDWVSKSNIKRHQKTCVSIDNALGVQSKRNLILQSDVDCGRVTSCASKMLKEEVFAIMTVDKISQIAQNDPLIVALGDFWLRQNIDNALKRAQYSSQRMRLAARLLIQLRTGTKNSAEMTMWDFLTPSHFDDIVNASLEIALPMMDDEEQLKSPSNCLKLKYDLIRLTNFKWSFIVKKNLENRQRKDCKNILKLMSVEYKTKVTKLGYTVLMRRSFTKSKQIPTPDDIELLNRHVHAELSTILLTPSNFKRIVSLVQCRLLSYNKRRSGEIDAISINNFRSRRKELSDVDRSLIGDLSVLEKHLLESQDLMIVRGKRGRGVPVIIPQDCQKPLDFLATREVRAKANIKDANPYLFPNKYIGAARSYESLKTLTSELNLQHPENITSVTMRKYTATLSQVINLDTQQLDWLCKHLGHTKRVHQEHYQTMSGFLERVKVSKLLLVQDLNLTKNFAGKKLDDITFEDVLLEKMPRENIETTEHETTEMNQNKEPAIFPKKRKISEEEESSDDELSTMTEAPKKKKRKTKCKRIRWTSEQTTEIFKFFKKHLESKTTPRKPECINIMAKSKFLKDKHYTDIIKKISNINHK